MMNSQGGTLVMGVQDDGSPYGLDRDLKLVRGKDGFQQLLASLVTAHLGAWTGQYYRVRFDALAGTDVCVVDVDRSPEPVFVKGDTGREFFVRVGNTTRPLDVEEAHQYIETHWD
jgi:hypothetical protein